MIKKYGVTYYTNKENGYDLGFDSVTAVIDEDVVTNMKRVIKNNEKVTQVTVAVNTFVLFNEGIRVDKQYVYPIDYCQLIVTENDTMLVFCIDGLCEEIFVDFEEEKSNQCIEMDLFEI